MKKLVLVLVCTVIMTVFIAFNYLLLDREKTTKSIETLTFSNQSKSSSIEDLDLEIKNSKEKISELNKTITTMEDKYSQLARTNSDLMLNLNENDKIINDKNELSDKIKTQIDTKPFETIINQWCDGLSEGQYETAYNLYKKADSGKDISLEEFSTDLKESIKSIKVKEIALKNDIVEGTADGNIVFKVSLDIKLLKAPSSYSYFEGLNERYFTFVYEKISDLWLISAISV